MIAGGTGTGEGKKPHTHKTRKTNNTDTSPAEAEVVIFLSDLCTQKHHAPALHLSRASCHYSQGHIEASSYPQIGSLLDGDVQFAAALKDP